ncbi:MAG: enolase C-terminal domain-like protein [Clostridia bacterium]
MSSFNKNNITIRDIEVITANLTGKNITMVKVLTSEPELYGLGCATFAYRNRAVEVYIKEYLAPLVIGRDVDNIEDLWHLMNTNGYWRNGPVSNNAISGIDMALWDIKGKIAGLPVYSLLGGKSRQGLPVYRHCDADTLPEILENIQMYKEQGFNHFRIQLGVYGGKPENLNIPPNSFPGDYFSTDQYMNDTIQLFDDVRSKLGYDVQLLHDSHERLTPIQAVDFAKRLEPYRLFFLEDILSPEQGEWYKTLRSQVSTPIAAGELFNNPKEWDFLIVNRLIDYVRIHVSQIGGLTPARKLAIFAEQFGIRTAWHGPSDASPVGHAVNAHLGIVSHNTGIQEWSRPLDSDLLQEAFPGMPYTKNGYLYVNEKPGLGLELNMDILKKYPEKHQVPLWTQTRHVDGTSCTP